MTHITFPKPPRLGRKPRKPIKRSTKPIARKKAPNKLRQSDHAKAERAADERWRNAIWRRSGGTCEARRELLPMESRPQLLETYFEHQFCYGHLDAAHGFPKGAYPSVRTDQRNGWLLCRYIHEYFGRHPEEWKAFMIRKLGEVEYQRLRNKALAGGKA